MKLDEILKKTLKEASGEKLHRDIFLYMSPKEPADQFAQCGTCDLFTGNRCAILGTGVDVSADMSCGSYVHGKPHQQRVQTLASPEEVGLVQRPVRCENCASSDGNGHCVLYQKLNTKFPEIFDLDINIEPQACCNAQSEK